MAFRDLLSVVWKRRGVVLVVFVVCVGAATAYALSQPKRYESTATIAFTPSPRLGQSYLPTDNLSALLSTYAAIAKSDQIEDAARTILGGPVPGDVETSTQAGSGVLDIIGKDTSPQGAADTARATAQAFVDSIRDNDLLVPTIVNPPVASDTPLQPRPPLIISMAAVLALIAGVLLALLLESFRRNVENAHDLAEVADVPVVGNIPRARALSRRNTAIVWDDPSLDGLQESFRNLRANVELLVDHTTGAAFQVTSADAEQGKSTIVANLGIAFAQLGIPTVIVDADLRRPRQHQIFELDNGTGLSTLLLLPDSETIAQPTRYPSLSVLTAGPTPPNATELLHLHFRHMLRDLRDTGALVIVDGPPTLPVSDARLIAAHADAVLFVVGVGRTRTTAVSSSLQELRFAQVNVAGLVLNMAARDEDATGDYGYRAHEPRSRRPIPILER